MKWETKVTLFFTSSFFLISILSILLGKYEESTLKYLFTNLDLLIGFFGLILLFLIIKKPLQQIQTCEKKIYNKRLINWAFFAISLIIILMSSYLIGHKFLFSNESYWLLFQALFIIIVSLIISYNPGFERIKDHLYNASTFTLFIIFTIVTILFFITAFIITMT